MSGKKWVSFMNAYSHHKVRYAPAMVRSWVTLACTWKWITQACLCLIRRQARHVPLYGTIFNSFPRFSPMILLSTAFIDGNCKIPFPFACKYISPRFHESLSWKRNFEPQSSEICECVFRRRLPSFYLQQCYSVVYKFAIWETNITIELQSLNNFAVFSLQLNKWGNIYYGVFITNLQTGWMGEFWKFFYQVAHGNWLNI